jgi:hypothetical protein
MTYKTYIDYGKITASPAAWALSTPVGGIVRRLNMMGLKYRAGSIEQSVEPGILPVPLGAEDRGGV